MFECECVEIDIKYWINSADELVKRAKIYCGYGIYNR